MLQHAIPMQPRLEKELGWEAEYGYQGNVRRFLETSSQKNPNGYED